MSEIVVSEIQIMPVRPKDGLVAFASCVVNNQFYLGSSVIYTCLSSPDGFRLVYPMKTLSNGTKICLVYPIHKEIGLSIQKEIVKQYLIIVDDLMKGGDTNGR
jgi:DNA-binding cell septation regulator SpoVG